MDLFHAFLAGGLLGMCLHDSLEGQNSSQNSNRDCLGASPPEVFDPIPVIPLFICLQYALGLAGPLC